MSIAETALTMPSGIRNHLICVRQLNKLNALLHSTAKAHFYAHSGRMRLGRAIFMQICPAWRKTAQPMGATPQKAQGEKD